MASPRVVPGDGLATLFIITNPRPLPMCLHRCISSFQAYCDWLWSLVRSKRTSWGPWGVGEGARAAGVGRGWAGLLPIPVNSICREHVSDGQEGHCPRDQSLAPQGAPVQGQEGNHMCGPLWSPRAGRRDSAQSEPLWTNPTYHPDVHSGMFPHGAYRC